MGYRKYIISIIYKGKNIKRYTCNEFAVYKDKVVLTSIRIFKNDNKEDRKVITILPDSSIAYLWVHSMEKHWKYPQFEEYATQLFRETLIK